MQWREAQQIAFFGQQFTLYIRRVKSEINRQISRRALPKSDTFPPAKPGT